MLCLPSSRKPVNSLTDNLNKLGDLISEEVGWMEWRPPTKYGNQTPINWSWLSTTTRPFWITSTNKACTVSLLKIIWDRSHTLWNCRHFHNIPQSLKQSCTHTLQINCTSSFTYFLYLESEQHVFFFCISLLVDFFSNPLSHYNSPVGLVVASVTSCVRFLSLEICFWVFLLVISQKLLIAECIVVFLLFSTQTKTQTAKSTKINLLIQILF